ncbi:ABC transporter permease [Methanogenium organophilum]|uniref:ABC transporter permease n=1 Tax=Methanogenium organophilum TaxID=2199 RepID=A0A9X9T7E2_METOG|nr:ABC transporter permease [Methanogenium organophilum]WAI00984.1 ABC transporter permease [Methanogenium organophilum]
METAAIPVTGLFFAIILIIIPVFVMHKTHLPMVRDTVWSFLRMSVQLGLAGIYLTVLFEYNNPLLNVVWLCIMIAVAAYESVRKQDLNIRKLYLPTVAAFVITTTLFLVYFETLILQDGGLSDARFLLPIGGMLLGNSLGGSIIGVSLFYNDLLRNENRYISWLSFGAQRTEALLPYFRTALRSALMPSLGNVAVMGIVFFPGMMTGQLIAGLSPMTAITYQIALMFTIYASRTVCVTLSIVLTSYASFDEFGMLNKEIFLRK